LEALSYIGFIRPDDRMKVRSMIALGLILLIIGLLVGGLHVLVFIGAVLLAVGLILALVGMAGREVGGRRHWY
jgi:membrane protein implicated in regulation of membrane protease activity